MGRTHLNAAIEKILDKEKTADIDRSEQSCTLNKKQEDEKSNAQAAVRNDEYDTTTESVIGGFIGKGCIQNGIITNLLKSLKTCCLKSVDSLVDFGSEEVARLVKWFAPVLEKGGCAVEVVSMHSASEHFPCKTASSAKRSCLKTETTEDLIRISSEGPPMAEFVPSLTVDLWFSSEEKPRRPFFKHMTNRSIGGARDINTAENSNRDLKKEIKSMGANKTDKALNLFSRASGGEMQTVENFDNQVNRGIKASSHRHQSSDADEMKVLTDLRVLKPFNTVPSRKHDSCQDVMSDPLATLNETDLEKWLQRHARNLRLDAPMLNDEEDET
ncbi:hypothetical protein ACROYT_G015085 [Oculina patagonica]